MILIWLLGLCQIDDRSRELPRKRKVPGESAEMISEAQRPCPEVIARPLGPWEDLGVPGALSEVSGLLSAGQFDASYFL